jgi:hypothetical protein
VLINSTSTRGWTLIAMSTATDVHQHQWLDLVGAEKRQQARALDGARWIICQYVAEQSGRCRGRMSPWAAN